MTIRRYRRNVVKHLLFSMRTAECDCSIGAKEGFVLAKNKTLSVGVFCLEGTIVVYPIDSE